MKFLKLLSAKQNCVIMVTFRLKDTTPLEPIVLCTPKNDFSEKLVKSSIRSIKLMVFRTQPNRRIHSSKQELF